MWKKLIALAVTIPATITIASAQAAVDADIAAYSQDLARRIALGRQTGQLTQANYNSVQSLYNNVEMIRRGLGNRPMNPMVRQNMMTSLTNLDKQLTGYLKDDVNARYQMWDPSRRSWRKNWWQADNSGANSFNQEIDAYQNSLRERIDRGRASGRITRSELSQLSSAYDNIDRAQQQYRIGGFSSYERNSLMSMLTQLDRDITTQMHDDENSHYRNWNSNGNSWKDSWWKRPGTSSFPASSNFPGNRPDGVRDGWRPGESGEHGNWNRGDSNRPDWNRGENSTHGDWNRGNSSGPEWNRGNSGRPDWNRGSNDRPDWSRGNSGRPDWSRNDASRPSTSLTPSTGSAPQSTPPGATAPAQTNPASAGSTQPTAGSPPASSGSGGASTPTAGSTPPAGVTPSAGAGSTSGRGGWGGRGDRTGDGAGRKWDGFGSNRPQN
ncbi:MAG: hypothetical protein K2Y39_04960 [Candidatus Obscuribacterales bacterium]|nr:hypothetical protein [Candidatus Obscuribacterales bacterium]